MTESHEREFSTCNLSNEHNIFFMVEELRADLIKSAIIFFSQFIILYNRIGRVSEPEREWGNNVLSFRVA